MNELFGRITELAEKYKDFTANNLSKLVKIKSTSMKRRMFSSNLSGKWKKRA